MTNPPAAVWGGSDGGPGAGPTGDGWSRGRKPVAARLWKGGRVRRGCRARVATQTVTANSAPLGDDVRSDTSLWALSQIFSLPLWPLLPGLALTFLAVCVRIAMRPLVVTETPLTRSVHVQAPTG